MANGESLEKIFKRYAEQKKRFTEAELHEQFGKDQYRELVPILNNQVKQRLLVLLQETGPKGDLIFEVRSEEEAAKYKGLSQDDMHVLQEITASGNSGVWVRNIKFKTKLQQGTINKILRNLEGRKLIKAIKSIASKNKKVYMLFDLVPSPEHTGGAWYTDQEFDEEFVMAIRNWVQRAVNTAGPDQGITVSDLTQQLRETKISQVELTEADVQLVVETLGYEGTVYELQPRAISGVRRYVPSPVVHCYEHYSEALSVLGYVGTNTELVPELDKIGWLKRNDQF